MSKRPLNVVEIIAVVLGVLGFAMVVWVFVLVTGLYPAKAWFEAELYDGSVMHGPVKLPRGSTATICFGGGCAGQMRINFTRLGLDEEIKLIFGEPTTAEAERAAISRTIDRVYRLVKPHLKPKDDGEDWGRFGESPQGYQYQGWECKTHAQNVSVVTIQMARLGLLQHYKVGPHAYSSGHFFGTLIAEDGTYWQLDSFFGSTIFSQSPGCVRGQAVCIRPLR